MTDFVQKDATVAIRNFAVNARITNASFDIFLPLPANVNAPFAYFVPTQVATPVPMHTPTNLQYRGWGKQVMDAVFVLLALPFIVPVVLFCAAALWLEGGQPFYRQDRLGKDGRTFSIWKLRTMVRNADQLLESHLAADPALRREWDSTQKLKNDPRVTRIGAFLRKTSLDELPQMLNVLNGEMSLVGPRPMMPDQLEMYGDAQRYFAVRPGITGIWQVSTRNEKGFSYRAQVDAIYFNSMSLGQDLVLLMKTVGVVLRRTGY